MSTADMAYVTGKGGNDDIRATNDPDGTMLRGGGGDDILRGGRFDDILVGGEGNDQMFGGDGADQFRFFLNEVSGTDTDYIRDLDFCEGDTLVFGNFAAGTFSDATGVDGYTNGTAATVSSFEGLKALVEGDGCGPLGWTAAQRGTSDVLILSYTDGSVTQEIQITGGWNAYLNAGLSEV